MLKVVFTVLLLVSISAASEEATEPELDARTNYENSICECVPYYQCNFNGSMNDDGEGVIDIRTGLVVSEDSPLSTRRPCEHYLSVCCLPPEISPDRDTDSGGDGGHIIPTQAPVGDFDPLYPTQQPIPVPPHVPAPAPSPGVLKPHVSKGCGYRNFNGINFRITGTSDNEVNFAEFPWMVAVLEEQVLSDNLVKVYRCGGSLIHKRLVLTGAHCVNGIPSSKIFIRAGEWDTQTTLEPLPHQDRDVSLVHIHEAFNPKNLRNDYALLILKTPVELADNVEVVCLPEPGDYFDYNNCFTTGWGKDVFSSSGTYQVILKGIELPVVPHSTCQANLRNTRLGKYFKLDQSFICAGGQEGIDACTGDGGGPLVCPLIYDPTRYTQAGIVAWGIGCGEKDVPGVYANVALARRWIDNILAKYNIDSISYSPGGNNNYPPVVGAPGVGAPVVGHQGVGTPVVGHQGVDTPVVGHQGVGHQGVGHQVLGDPRYHEY